MFKPSNKLKLMQKENDLRIHPIQVSPYVSTKSTFEVEKVPQATSTLAPDSFPSSNVGKISPIVLLMIIILAAIFFISGCLHLLFRYLVKRPPSRSLFNSNRFSFNTDNQASTHVLQRQLQQLFRLHDSGLDQSYIDSLPVFHYNDVLIGLDLNMKQQFDCAVCLSEFSNQDKLKLLPLCSHAFHINCIDPWLMSNSTCPLCRTTLLNPPPTNLPSLPQLTSSDDSTEMSLSLSTGSENSTSTSISNSVSSSSSATLDEKRVYSIRLGKFRTLSNNDSDIITSSKLDGRRCYSMGSYQYIVTHDSYLKVALDLKLRKVKGGQDGDDHCVSIGGGISSLRGDSFSVSKIWLWSKKRKYEDDDYCDSKMARLGRLEIV